MYIFRVGMMTVRVLAMVLTIIVPDAPVPDAGAKS
jgi:hypothetical protein